MQNERIVQTKNPIVGKNIRELREMRGLRNIDVVRALQLKGVDIARSNYSHIELGLNNPTVDLLIALTDILGCDFNAFFKQDSSAGEIPPP